MKGPMRTPCSRVSKVLTAAFVVAALLQAEGGAAEVVSVKGKVKITKHTGWEVLAATLTTNKGEVYHLVPDEKGADFAKVMFGKVIEILGEVSARNGEKWLRIVGYPTPEETSAHELWRRMRCNACVVHFAARHAAVPPAERLGEFTPIAGRHFYGKAKFTTWSRDNRFLWLATDNAVLQIDFESKKLVRSYGQKEGLPDRAIYQIESDGKTLWVVHRGGVAAITIGSDKAVDLPKLKASFARAHSDAAGTWIVADTGTFRLKSPADPPSESPPIPTAGRIRNLVENGIWVGHWQSKTQHFLTTPVSLGDRLYVGSYGDVYELADGTWQRIARRGWELRAGSDRIWFVGVQGLMEYDPETRKTATHTPPDISEGRYTGLVLSDGAVWITAEPKLLDEGKKIVGGGLARLDPGSGQWRTWQAINGHPTDHARCFTTPQGELWVVTLAGDYMVKGAHPGMSYVKQKTFNTTGFCLHRFKAKEGAWESLPLGITPLEDRLICGQDGGSGTDSIVPQVVEGICVGPTRIFGILRLLPCQFFSGYWPSIAQIASRDNVDAPWIARFEHHPDQLNLQGEQPMVLNISNKGQMILEAVGHDSVLALFYRDETYWAVTEGCVAFREKGSNTWRTATESAFRFYWRATAALDDGRFLYIGSDRGLVSRLDLETGRFEILAALRKRTISRIVKGKNGEIVVAAKPAPIGMLPVQLRETLDPMDCDAVKFDGKAWVQAKAAEQDLSADEPQWSIRPVANKDHSVSRFLRDKSRGNRLWGPIPGVAEPRPRFYVKEVFSPEFLCASPDGRRVWLATFSGLLRLDLGPKGTAE